MGYLITRRIEIDAGHRIPQHNSKCRHLHGHRYKIEASLSAAALQSKGSQSGMVQDFGVLKDVMKHVIHDVFDHTLILYIDDPIAKMFWSPEKLSFMKRELQARASSDSVGGKFYLRASTDELNLIFVLCTFIPTAENLAEAWYEALSVHLESHFVGYPMGEPIPRLESVKVWETPNCAAIFPWGDNQ